MDEREGFCRVGSIEAGEAQYGTAAAGVDAWFALEFDCPWASKAWEAAAIPEAARAHVDAWVAATRGARIQLIRREGRRGAGDIVLLLASTRQDRPLVAEFRLASLDALTALDLHAAIAELRAGRLPAAARVPALPIALVCTNGKRDRCCAKWGVPIYEALAADPRVEAWQTTHLGGHRFAATLVWLPSGICHGRVGPGHVDALVTAIASGEVGPLDLVRGRTSLSEAAQAAEVLCRQESALHGLDDVVMDATAIETDGTWQVTGRMLEQPVRFTLREVALGTTAAPSCGKPSEPVTRWELA